MVIFLALAPPGDERRELLELDGRGLGVVLPAFGQWRLVMPELARWPGAVEEQEVRRDAGVGREHPVKQPDDGVEVEVLEQPLLDASAGGMDGLERVVTVLLKKLARLEAEVAELKANRRR